MGPVKINSFNTSNDEFALIIFISMTGMDEILVLESHYEGIFFFLSELKKYAYKQEPLP